MNIEIVYAPSVDEQDLIALQVVKECTVVEAIQYSGVLAKHPEINLATQAVGIFGSVTDLNTVLYEGARIEIYRPLTLDPKKQRKLRIIKQRKK